MRKGRYELSEDNVMKSVPHTNENKGLARRHSLKECNDRSMVKQIIEGVYMLQKASVKKEKLCEASERI